MRFFSTLVILLFLGTGLMAQRLVPLQTNEAQQKAWQQQRSALPFFPKQESVLYLKDECTFDLDEAIVALAEDGTRVVIPIDTTGLSGPNSDFRCINCPGLVYGTVDFEDDEVVYTANPDVIEGFDTLQIAFCNNVTNFCSDTISLTFFARRLDNDIYPAEVKVSPEGRVVLEGDPSLLPGTLACSELIDCEDDYQGREKLFYFTDYSQADFRFVYQASRYDGVDSICLRLCNERGICDTYRYAIRINQPVRNLPFFDDFSYEGPITDAGKWLDRGAFVNRTMSQNPPSVGMATLDGISYRGKPYGFSPGIRQQRETLTSVPLALGGADDPVLTYYVQPRGLGDRPETLDSLLVQFLRPDGRWQTVTGYNGIPNSEGALSPQPWKGFVVPITESFRYDGFRFRFVNKSDETGSLDVWNIDYVRVDDVQTDLTFPDVAFTRPPNYVTEPYSSLPYRHLEAAGEDLINDTLVAGIWNHADEALSVASSVTIREEKTGLPLLQATLFNAQEANIPNGMPIVREYDLESDPFFSNVYPAFADDLLNDPTLSTADRLCLTTRYALRNTTQISGPGFECVQRNDTVETVTVLDNYFAYDDGTAELALEALTGQEVVQRYEAFVPDVLRGVQFRFPRNTIDFSQQRMEIVVYLGELDDSPEYIAEVNPVFAENFQDTLQGFTSYPLGLEGGPDSLEIPVGPFYVGWRQITTCTTCIAVGFDRNRPTTNTIFFNNGAGWFDLPGPVRGALMIRPVVGGESPGYTPVEEPVAAEPQLQVFPNPASDQLQLLLDGQAPDDRFVLQLFDTAGRQVYRGQARQTVNVSRLPAGVYHLLLQRTEDGMAIRRKVIISR